MPTCSAASPRWPPRPGAPFVAGIGPDALKTPLHEQHPLTRDAWTALRALPAAAYLGLATPRFLLRMPYGKKTDPIDAFAFEEFTRQGGLSGMLWGNPALLPAAAAGRDLAERQGAKMKLGTTCHVGDMPYYVYHRSPTASRSRCPAPSGCYTERTAAQVAGYGVMPLLSLRGRPEVRLGGFASLAGPPLAGFWAPVDVTPPKPAPRSRSRRGAAARRKPPPSGGGTGTGSRRPAGQPGNDGRGRGAGHRGAG